MERVTYAPRDCVIRAIRVLAESLKRTLIGEIDEGASHEVDMGELLAFACSVTGLLPSEYAIMIALDAELGVLEKEALDEALLGTPDPGPYDAIPPNSSTGSDGVLVWG
jgi:hypothetical protein